MPSPTINMIPELKPAEQALVTTAREFAREQVAPYAEQWEWERRVPLDTFRAAAEAGLTRLLPHPDQGGHGLSCTALARVMEELAAACLPFAFMLVVHNNLAGNIARNGSPAQAERFLPPLLAGERLGAFCLTEPGTGSDAAAIVTRGRQEGAEWVLDGEKAWVTNGAVAGLYSVYAQTDPAAGWRGIACLLVEEDAAGLTRTEPYRLAGGHAMGVSGLRLAGCRVPEENVLLPAGQGFKAAMAGIDLARTLVGAMCSGMMHTALETALDYASQRNAFGHPIADFQGLRWQLADVATELEAARLLTYQAAAMLDDGRDTALAAAHAKKFATRVALAGIAECMQAMGAEGLKAGHPLGRHLASAKLAQFIDGTTEIQNVVIARALFQGRGGGQG